MNLAEDFTTTMEHRHWMACHDLGALSPMDEREMRLVIEQVLPPNERTHWLEVCHRYDKHDLPGWFQRFTEKEMGL